MNSGETRSPRYLLGRLFRIGWLLPPFVISSSCGFLGVHTDRVPTAAMEPTIKNGEVILWKVLGESDRASLDEGVVVVIRAPGEPDKRYVKRIVAMGGEQVQIHNNALLVDNEEIDRPYAHGRSRAPDCNFGPKEVPEGHVFLLGDNWDYSRDSRTFGSVPASEVIGQVLSEED